jgi:secreted trypsin-like serine protease
MYEAEHGFQVAGWGKTETGRITNLLQFLPLTRVNDKTCEEAHQSKSQGFHLLASQTCATGDKEERADSCNGDSGGPLMVKMAEHDLGAPQVRTYLAGIVSFGDKFCDSSTPTVYTRVASFYSWIAENMPSSEPKGRFTHLHHLI